MGLEDVFPQDPFTPSLSYAAAAHLPVTVPWTGKVLRMGTPLIVGSQAQETKFLETECAFSSDSMGNSSLAFRHMSRGMEAETSTHSAASSHEHTSFSLSAEIGGSVIGVSGQGNYEARALTNQDAHNASFRTEHQAGWIGFVSPPRLSPLALEVLHTHDSPHSAFRDRFGDYYVGAYLLGATNAQLLSSNDIAVSSSKDLSGKGEAHAFGFSVEKSIENHDKAEAMFKQIHLTAYDTLDNWDSGPSNESVQRLVQDASENDVRGRTLVHRVTGRMEEFQLEDGVAVSWETCDNLCRAHLVVEIQLLPYVKLREYAVAVLAAESLKNADPLKVESGAGRA